MPTTFLSSPQINYVIPLPHNNVIGFNSKETLKSFLEKCFLGNTQYDDLNQLEEYFDNKEGILNAVDHIIETNQPKQGTVHPSSTINIFIDVKTLLKEFDDPVKWLQPQEPQSYETERALVPQLESSVTKLILEMLNDLARFLTLGLLIQVKLLSSRSQTALITHSPSMQIQSRPVSQPVCPAIFSPNQTTNWIEPAMTMNISAFDQHEHHSHEPNEDGFGDPSSTLPFIYWLSTIGLATLGVCGLYSSQAVDEDALSIELGEDALSIELGSDDSSLVSSNDVYSEGFSYGRTDSFESEWSYIDDLELFQLLERLYWRVCRSSEDVLSILNTEDLPENIKRTLLGCFRDVDRPQGQLNFKKMIRTHEVHLCFNKINDKMYRQGVIVNSDQGFSHRSSLMRCEQSWSDEFKMIGSKKDGFDFKMNKMRTNVSRYLNENPSSNLIVTVGENRIQDAILMVLCLREQGVQFKVKTNFELDSTHPLNQFFNTDQYEETAKQWLPVEYARHAICDGEMVDNPDPEVVAQYSDIPIGEECFDVELEKFTDFEKVEWLKYMSLIDCDEYQGIRDHLNEIHTAALDNDTKSFSDFFKESLDYFSELERRGEHVELEPEPESFWSLAGWRL